MTLTERRVFRPMVALFALAAIAAGLFMLFPANGGPHARQLSVLRGGDTVARRTAAEELGTADAEGLAQVVAALTAALADEEPGVRARAAHSLGRQLVLHPDVAGTSSAREALVRSLGDRTGQVRGSAAVALSLVGYDPEKLVPGLIDSLQGDDPLLRGEADAALSAPGVPDEGRLRTLLALLGNPTSAVRDAAANALMRVEPGPDPRGRVRLLIGALADERPSTRGAVAASLGRAGRGLPEARAALIEALADADLTVRAAAAGGLEAFADDPPAREALRRAVDDDEAIVREAAATSLTSAPCSPREEALAALAQFQRQDGPLANLADLAVLTDSETEEPALRLIGALDADDPWVREAVAHTLGVIAPKTAGAAAAVAALTPLLRDPDPAVSVAAAEALGRFRTAAVAAIPELREANRRDNRRVSAFAAAALKRIEVARGD